MPILNARVKVLVDRFAGGNVSKFVAMLNEGHPEEEISQQRFNRLFNIDKKINKYPGVPISITKAITNRFVEVSHKWLLSGEGEMLVDRNAPFHGNDSLNWERAAIKALSWGLANALSEISALKGKPRDPSDFLEEIERSTNMILNDLRKSGKS